MQSELRVKDYPIHKHQILKLINSHKKLKETRPTLVIWFSKNNKKDIHLLEVSENVPNTYNDEQKLFRIEFTSTPSFIIATGGSLWLYWVSESDFLNALRKKDKDIVRIAKDLKNENAECIYKNKKGNELLQKLLKLT